MREKKKEPKDHGLFRLREKSCRDEQPGRGEQIQQGEQSGEDSLSRLEGQTEGNGQFGEEGQSSQEGQPDEEGQFSLEGQLGEEGQFRQEGQSGENRQPGRMGLFRQGKQSNGEGLFQQKGKKEFSLRKRAGKTKGGIQKKNAKGRKISMAFLAPSVSGVMLFFVVPFFVVIYYAVVNNPIQHEFVFLDNFINVFRNAAFRQAAYNTMKFSLIAVPLAVALSLGLAMLLDSKIPFKSQFRTFFLTPMMVPIASIVLIWQVLFHYNGMVNDITALFGSDKIDWLKSEHAQVVIIVLFLWKNLGYNMILFMAALGSIPKDILEVAVLESAKSWQVFIHIKIRYLSSTVLFVTIMSLINSFKVFREIYLLTDDYPYNTVYMMQHFMNNTFGNLDYQKLSAAAIMMSLVMVVIIGILFLTENYFGKDVEG